MRLDGREWPFSSSPCCLHVHHADCCAHVGCLGMCTPVPVNRKWPYLGRSKGAPLGHITRDNKNLAQKRGLTAQMLTQIAVINILRSSLLGAGAGRGAWLQRSAPGVNSSDVQFATCNTCSNKYVLLRSQWQPGSTFK